MTLFDVLVRVPDDRRWFGCYWAKLGAYQAPDRDAAVVQAQAIHPSLGRGRLHAIAV